MAIKKLPRKPSSPLGHIVFPKQGKPYRVIEPLPNLAEDLEATITRKFVGAMKRFENRELSIPKRGKQWPDFETKEGETRIGIELVEVINVDHARRRHLQDRYVRCIRGLLSDILPRLAGLSIQLIDGYQCPPYPHLNTGKGQQLVRLIASSIRLEVEGLERLEGRTICQWQKRSGLPQAGAFITRVAPSNAGIQVSLAFPGFFPEWVSVSENLLSQAIERKLKKNYPRYKGGRLWLLAYEVFSMSVNEKPSKSANLARDLLRKPGHPFDEVWYFYPYADMDLGHIEQVWPIDSPK